MKLSEFKAISYQINNYSMDPFIEKISEKFGYDEWYSSQIRPRIYNNTMGVICNHKCGDYLFELIWEAAQKNYPELIEQARENSEPIKGTTYTAEQWLKRAVRNAIPRGSQDGVPIDECERWVAVMGAFGCGSTYAQNLCREMGVDPFERIEDKRFQVTGGGYE